MTTPKEEYIEGKGGRLFVRSWRPDSAPRAVVALCHGFNAHSGYYGWTADQLVSDGYAVYAVDLRGRGKSDGERFYVKDVSEYEADVDALVNLAKSREPKLQTFLLGHSAGGVTSVIYTLDYQKELDGLICMNFAYQVPSPDFAIAALKGLAHIVPHAHVVALKNENFSRDPAAVKAMNEDPLIAHETQPTSTMAALAHADERLKKEFGKITLPVLIMHGKADKVTKWEGSQEFYDKAGSSDKTLKLYEGHYHDMLNDTGKETVIRDIQQWLAAHVHK
jgi:alpha-beta hydrolase superfamily lysophospholipase